MENKNNTLFNLVSVDITFLPHYRRHQTSLPSRSFKYSQLHWLRMSQRIDYKLAVLVYRCLNGLAPSYLASDLQRVAGLDARRRLHSASTSTLLMPATCLSTVGDHAFPVAAARVWNSLPADVTSSPSLPTFQRWLKTELFARSYS